MIRKLFTDPTGIQTFHHEQFGQIRTMTNEQGELFFVGKDVGTALGYKNTRDALAKHVDADDKTTVAIRDTGSGQRSKTVLINESGLYSLVLSSQLPSAKAFKRWVTAEVLPQIRRTGGYIPTRDLHTGKALSEEEIVERAFSIMQQTISRENLPADDCLSMTEVAKLFGLEAQDLISFLRDQKVIKRQGGLYVLTDRFAGLGYDSTRVHHSFSLDGRPKVRPYLVWTPAGAAFVTRVVNGKEKVA